METKWGKQLGARSSPDSIFAFGQFMFFVANKHSIYTNPKKINTNYVFNEHRILFSINVDLCSIHTAVFKLTKAANFALYLQSDFFFVWPKQPTLDNFLMFFQGKSATWILEPFCECFLEKKTKRQS